MSGDIKTIAEFIANYGILVIIGAIFIYVVIRLIRLGFVALEKRMANKEHEKALDVRSEIGKQVQRLITRVLSECSGTRIHVIEFSNSVLSVAYLPFKYMTCTYEVYKLGKSATGHKIDKLPTSLFIPFFAELDEHEYCIFDINDPTCPMGGAMTDLMKAQEEFQSLCVALKTPKGKHIGYIELIKETEFLSTDIDEMTLLGQQLVALLTTADVK